MKYRIMTAALAVIGMSASQAQAFNLEDIQFWTGTGTNRAALLIEWNAPEVYNNTEVSAPIASKTLAWGYRWDGIASATEMLNAVLSADQQLFAVLSEDTGYGSMIMGLGYDWNHNRAYGVQNGTQIQTYSYQTSVSDVVDGIITLGYSDADVFNTLEPADLYWGGVNGPSWELWQEKEQNGGFTTMPDRGANPYWTADDPGMPWSGSHGEWTYVSMGISGITLSDGSWIGFTISAGGLDYANSSAPGTIAYYEHKHAPANPVAASLDLSPYATEVADSHEPFSNSELYAEPTSVLGEPTTWAQDLAFFGDPDPFRVKLVKAAYNLDLNGDKTLLTLDQQTSDGVTSYGSVTVKFDHPVLDDPSNPYGIDFEVFGNTFYVGSGFVCDSSDLSQFNLTGGAFGEPLLVSVSPDGENWYTYTDGPYCDSTFPTQGFAWDSDLFTSTGSGWTKKKMDFTKPVNPVLDNILGSANTITTVSDAIRLYAGSGGGTGFDLAESGFESIQYIRVEAADGYTGGELDAFSDVRPAYLGEGLTVAPGNLEKGAYSLFFMDPSNAQDILVQVNVQSAFEVMLVKPSHSVDEEILSQLSENALSTLQVEFEPVLVTDIDPQICADILWNLAYDTSVSLDECSIQTWNGTEWETAEYSENASNILFKNINGTSIFALVPLGVPNLAIQFVDGKPVFTFTTRAGWKHVLERSTDFVQWNIVQEVDAFATAESLTIEDSAAPVEQAFYRLRLIQGE